MLQLEAYRICEIAREGFDPDGLAACAAHVDGLDRLSKERIGSELIKLLRAPDPSFAVAGLRQTGALSRILPGADSTLFGQFVAQIKPHDAIARLAFLGGQDTGSALRLSKPQAKRLAQILGEVGSQTPAYELAYRYGAADAHAMLAMRSVLIGPLKFNPDDLVSAASQVFPVSANDLMPNVSGLALGKALRDLEARWIKSDFRLTREELLQGWFH